jgi:hypothetical protein
MIKHAGNTMIDKLMSWKPALFGFVALGIEQFDNWIKPLNEIATFLVAISTFVYISVRIYYLIKNKGKEK